MRTSIVLWSAFSGAVLGLFVDATLIGVALLLSAAIPGLSSRFQQRWLGIAALALLALILTASVALGYLEGQLKTR
ncbi:MAG TPA: hypothetical protein VI259_00685 [Gemmatimonadaceae bacterium]